MSRAWCRAWLVAGALLCAASLAAELPVSRYRVRLDEQLSTLAISVCGVSATARLAPRDAAGVDYLRKPPIRTANGCFSYEFAAHRAAARDPRYRALTDQVLIVPPALWLWRDSSAVEQRVEVEFDLPRGMTVSVPWEPRAPLAGGGPRFAIPPSPHSDNALAALGRFDRCRLVRSDASFDVALLPGHVPAHHTELLAWLGSALDNLTRVNGRLPQWHVQVLVVPVANTADGAGEPVPFGQVIRDGGETVQLFVNQRRPLRDLVNDWTATHEFAHLLLPHVPARDKWIAEGLASYYQNVLMARGGHYRARAAWQALLAGFARGRSAVPDLNLEDAMPLGHEAGIMKTYWGGAAIFLMADVALREQSGNRATLDSVLAALASCCLPATHSFDGRALFTRLDELAPQPVFVDLYERYHANREFPAVASLLARLGVVDEGARLSLAPHAELAPLRRAIMARRAAVTALHDVTQCDPRDTMATAAGIR